MQVKLLFSISKNKVSTCLSFCCFFIIFGLFLEALGYILASFWSLCRLFWRVGVILLGAFGSPGLSVGCLCYFLWCLWLVWAVCGLGDRSGFVFRDLFHVFSIVFSFASVVEAAPQARPKTTAVANTVLRPSPCISQNSCFTCMGALFRSNMGRHLQTPFWDHFWLHFGVILESLLKWFR